MFFESLRGILVDPDGGFFDEIVLKDALNRYRDLLKCRNIVFPCMYIGLARFIVACDYDMWSKTKKASGLDARDRVTLRGPVLILGCEDDGRTRSLNDDEVKYLCSAVSLTLVNEKPPYTTYVIKPITHTLDAADIKVSDEEEKGK